MADDDPERDEEWFKEVYGKEYTGPSSLYRGRPEESAKNKAEKRSGEASDDEEKARDPNAVPTDFTSREAKVWEAKAKAIERNWKRKKEEELHCKICGEPGHFAQGCPTTLGGKRKPSEVVERIPLRDKRLKPRLIGTGGSVIQGIEKETGCRLKLEDSNNHGGVFHVRVAGPDRVAVSKAVNAVSRLAEQFEDEWSRNSGQLQSSKRHKSSSGFVAQVDERVMDPKREWGSIQVVNGGTGRTVKFRDEYFRARGGLDNGGTYPASRRQGYEQDVKASAQSSFPQTLEELEQSFLQEAVELSKEQSTEEDREISRHRQCIREIQEQYQQKMMNLRTKQSLEREEFLRQQYYHHQPDQQSGYMYEASHAHAYSYGGYDFQLRNGSPSFAYGRNSPYQRHH